MKNVVGNPARERNFFQRNREIEKIISRIKDNNNLQIAAPRRIGKTSILFYLLDNQVNDYIYVYIDTERVDNEQDFYKKILKEIFKVEAIAKSRKLNTLLQAGGRFFNKIRSIKILGNELNFNEIEKDVDYYEELTNFLSGFELDGYCKLVLLIDEFPQTILNILVTNNGDKKKGVQFLQSNRDLRLHPETNRKIRFIYTGSIGLNHTTASINASAFVNDLSSVEIEPLTKDEAVEFISQLLSDKRISIDAPAVDHLLQKIEWYIPFHIQLAIQELLTLAYDSRHIDTNKVNQAFEKIIELRNNNHFEHYYSRLKSQFKGRELQYAEALLQKVADEGQTSKSGLFDLAIDYEQEGAYRQIIDTLTYDGYLNNTGNINVYRFNSPIVRMWWQKFICK